LPKY